MKRLSALLLAFLLATLCVTAGGHAIGKPKKPKVPNVQSFRAKLHVAGGVTITNRHNTLSECSPGQAWTMTEKADLVINDEVVIQRRGNLVYSTSAREAGAVQQRSRISGYRTTNNCPPNKPAKLVKPKCTNLTGTGLATLTPDPRFNGKVSIGLYRKGGGRQDLSCYGPGVDSTPKGSAITALQTSFTPISLPLNVSAKAFKNLKNGKRIISVAELGGRCEFGVVSTSRRLTNAAVDDCEVDGTFNILIKRIRD